MTTESQKDTRALGRVERLKAVWTRVASRCQIPAGRQWFFFSLAAGLVLLIGICAAALIDPRAAWFPKCLFHQATGLNCPGCGTGRAIYAFAHGAWREGFRLNALLPFAILFLIVILVKPSIGRSRKVALVVFCVVFGWMIVRNILSL